MLVEVAKAEVAVQGRVPGGHLPERGQRDGGQIRGDAPGPHCAEQRPTDPAPLVVGIHAHLLDVRASVDHVGEHVADGPPGRVYGDPGAPRLGVASEELEGRGLVLGHFGHADVPEPEAGSALDVQQRGPVVGTGRSDAHLHAGMVTHGWVRRAAPLEGRPGSAGSCQTP